MKYYIVYSVIAVLFATSSNAQTTYSKTFYVTGSNESQYIKFAITTNTVNIKDIGNYNYQKINFEINCTLTITAVNFPSTTSIYGNITFGGSSSATDVTTYFPASGDISTTTSPYTYTTSITTTSNSTISAYYDNLSDKSMVNNTSILPLAAFSLAKITFNVSNYNDANGPKGAYSFDNYNTDSSNYLISTSNYSLPITLTDFTATSITNAIQLNWSTSSEINNKYYALQRSENAIEYDSIGVVNGSGTTNSINNYSYIDYNYSPTINYYRLKQVDYDGNYSLSKVISINMTSNSNNDISIYPNPGNGQINIKGSYDNIKMIQLYNISGQLMDKIIPSSNQFQLRNGLSSGFYIIKIILKNNNPISLKYMLR
ncbi:T9SS type A sorting domain-containing protein [Rhizosphaericola mali]|uniref:T9SS type A sorting domain-containing protein n=1 Tax=Rhizosphaericola mali TaxID=2545455 RepID=A0A5P2G1U6_9BACT|nr:T9SS type A sorting domain-containing protein [Rhizosphaericola mali]QES89147.1 T9SS type A sorting domain-containing protein [Rhizosphaericola mali]